MLALSRRHFACALVALASFATLGFAAAPARSESLIPLRVMTTPIENGAQVYYAKELGFFEQAGLDVDVQSVQSGSAIAAAVTSGAADIGFSSIVPLALAHIKHFPFVLIAPGGEWTQGARNSALFTGTATTIHSGKDLSGKTVGIAGLGTLGDYAVRAWIDHHGGDSSAVKFVELPYSTMVEALRAGRIDVASINEPFISAAAKNGRFLGYQDDAIANQFLVAGWFSTADWARDHADAVQRFATVMRKTARWANDPANRAASSAILVKYTHADPAMVETMVHVHFGDSLTPAGVQPQIDAAAKYTPFADFPAQLIIAGSTAAPH
jgi:NitT/TauT family transport system substrate-binding protein